MAKDPEVPTDVEARLAELRRSLPDEPGIYKYFDAEGKILYVGKAISLRKRVNSYFTKTGHDFKTRVLVKQIRDIQFVVTHNDMEALLLENNLIKQYQPKYNIMLKDGKTYPYICIKNERFPRVFSTRNKIRDGSQYYGPYASIPTMNAILLFLRDSFKLRTCSLVLSEKNISDGKFRPCLEFHLGNCAAPCVAKQTEAEYNEDIRQIRQVLRGKFRALLDQLKADMQTASERMEFERAHYLKKRIEHIQKYRRRSTVVSENVTDVEVLTVLTEEGISVVNHFRIIDGAIVQTHQLDVRMKNEETEAELVEAVVTRLQAEEENLCKRILTNVAMPTGTDLAALYSFETPTRGDELKVLELSLKNCRAILDEKLNIARLHRDESPTEKMLRQAQKDLRLTLAPRHIECFDNSNIQGYAPVAACVVFKNGKPAKRDYRVYNIKTVVGPDDFASMQEVVTRRYRRLLDEAQPLPDLIMIDGGKGQLSHALAALQSLGLDTKITCISIAKRLEEIYYKDDPVPMYIDKKSSTLRLLQRIRNEAHNTAINYHRKKRDQKTLRTELTEIPGVGATTAKKLLSELKTVKRIQEAPAEALAAVVGPAKAQIVYDYYREQNILVKTEAEPDEQRPTEEPVGPRNPRLPNLRKPVTERKKPIV